MIGKPMNRWIRLNKMALGEIYCLLLLAYLTSGYVYQGREQTNCGWPGEPVGGRLIAANIPQPINRPVSGGGYVQYNSVLSYNYVFYEGQVVSYVCNENQLNVLTGANAMFSMTSVSMVNRTCQGGRWSGTRPYCDVNVAFGKLATFSSTTGSGSSRNMTDGLIDNRNPENTAECTRFGSFFEIDLEQGYAVRTVSVYGKSAGYNFGNLVGRKLTLDSTFPCTEKNYNKSFINYECQPLSMTYNPGQQQYRKLRFEHTSSATVPICEVIAYANPALTDCGEPEIPANGEVAITINGSRQDATYRCNYGYELSGDIIRSCYGRNWGGEQPICYPSLSSSTERYNITTTPYWDGEHNGGGLETFQIVLIVICVLLVIGLIVTLIILIKYGRITCCCGNNRNRVKKPSPYAEVPQVEDNTTARHMAHADEARRKEEAYINTQLAFEPKPPLRTEAGNQQQTTYAELQHEPTRRKVEDSPLASPVAAVQPSPIYAQVSLRTQASAPPADDSSVTSDANNTAVTDTSFNDQHYFDDMDQPKRKSYIPLVYLKESPEVQMRQQALNEQLKTAVKSNRVTESDF